jgi:hypothetical protein
VSITSPDQEGGVRLPQEGEPLKLGDIGQVTGNAQIQKALRRLAADKAPTSLSQLVMWRVAGGLEWEAISRLSEKWANGHELTLAKQFVDQLDTLPAGETGRVLFQVSAGDESSEPMASEIAKVLDGKTVLGLVAKVGEIPSSPDSPAVACRVRLNGKQALVQVMSSDETARNWVPFGKLILAVKQDQGKPDAMRFADELAEGILSRLVRAQVIKGTARDKAGKLVYQIRIENVSPLILNGIAMVGTETSADETPKVWWGLSISPRRGLTLPATEADVRTLGLKKGIKLLAIDLSGL